MPGASLTGVFAEPFFLSAQNTHGDGISGNAVDHLDPGGGTTAKRDAADVCTDSEHPFSSFPFLASRFRNLCTSASMASFSTRTTSSVMLVGIKYSHTKVRARVNDNGNFGTVVQ